MLSEHVALSLLTRYRHARTSELRVAGVTLPPVQDLGTLDFSGMTATVSIRVFAR
jgi:hypothetical protein